MQSNTLTRIALVAPLYLLFVNGCSTSDHAKPIATGGSTQIDGNTGGSTSTEAGIDAGGISDGGNTLDASELDVTDGSVACDNPSVPTSIAWKTTGPLITVKPDSTHPVVSIKDPSIVYYKDRWLVYATTADTASHWSMVYLSFTDFSEAANAPQYFLSNNPAIGTGYHCAPQVFYFSPQNKWYLVYQSGPPQFSTTDDPTKPETWSAPQSFFSTTPDVVLANQGSGGWLDNWIICDTANCYLFFSDDNGNWYRSQTTIQDFPNGMGNTTLVMHEANKNDLFEGSNVYKLKGTNKYLADVECIGPTGQRYFRSWTADTLDGQWTPLLDSWDKPFIGANNVTSDSSAGIWTAEFSHGEMIRDGYDETMTVDPCHMQFLYQGVELKKEIGAASYPLIPWKLGLVIQSN